MKLSYSDSGLPICWTISCCVCMGRTISSGIAHEMMSCTVDDSEKYDPRLMA